MTTPPRKRRPNLRTLAQAVARDLQLVARELQVLRAQLAAQQIVHEEILRELPEGAEDRIAERLRARRESEAPQHAAPPTTPDVVLPAVHQVHVYDCPSFRRARSEGRRLPGDRNPMPAPATVTRNAEVSEGP